MPGLRRPVPARRFWGQDGRSRHLPHFVLEKIDAPPALEVDSPGAARDWLLLLSGHARIGLIARSQARPSFLEHEATALEAGPPAWQALVAYGAGQPDIDDASPGSRKPIPLAGFASTPVAATSDDVTDVGARTGPEFHT